MTFGPPGAPAVVPDPVTGFVELPATRASISLLARPRDFDAVKVVRKAGSAPLDPPTGDVYGGSAGASPTRG